MLFMIIIHLKSFDWTLGSKWGNCPTKRLRSETCGSRKSSFLTAEGRFTFPERRAAQWGVYCTGGVCTFSEDDKKTISWLFFDWRHRSEFAAAGRRQFSENHFISNKKVIFKMRFFSKAFHCVILFFKKRHPPILREIRHLFLITFALKMRKVVFWSPFIYLYACYSHNTKY